MSNETTPAIERAAAAMADDWNPDRDPILTAMFRDYAQSALKGALTDPDDPDSLARTLFVLHHEATGWLVGARVFDASPSRKQWRAVADGLRATFLGGAS